MVDAKREREKKTVEKMIHIYCIDHHNTHPSLCEECEKLLSYATKRILKCQFNELKPVCQKCPIHCYGKNYRKLIRDTMRYSGPKMLFHSPYYAVMHLWDSYTVPVPVTDKTR